MPGAEALTTREDTVVLYPLPGMGHLVSMVELAKLFLRHAFRVTVLILDPPFNTGSTAPFISRVSAANPSISFHHLPPVPSLSPAKHPESLFFELIRLSNPHLQSYLSSIPALPVALVLDTFCTCALDVAARLAVPAYLFYTSGANSLTALLHLLTIDGTTTKSFRDLGSELVHFPGVSPIPADHMPLSVLDRHDDAYTRFIDGARRVTEAAGILVNTFEALDERAIKAIRDGLSVPEGARTPPVYCVGPLISSDRRGGKGSDDCLSWLDSQPKASVVFLSFGSLGRFSAEQLREIAAGLEGSGQRFLWVVRAPHSQDPSQHFAVPPEPDLDALLPPGFLERTSDRGLVVKSWAPQVDVLAHEAVGAFVTHLGWNSILEGICAGVPMVGWPLYAEQRMNKVFLVDDAKLATVMEGYDEELVKAEEVEKRVREVMESEEGRRLRKRTMVAKESAAAAVAAKGKSYMAMHELVRTWRGE